MVSLSYTVRVQKKQRVYSQGPRPQDPLVVNRRFIKSLLVTSVQDPQVHGPILQLGQCQGQGQGRRWHCQEPLKAQWLEQKQIYMIVHHYSIAAENAKGPQACLDICQIRR